jgi:ribosome modulation factor
MQDKDDDPSRALRDKPRERGKDAYRAGQSLQDNPYPDAASRCAWAEGWIYEQVHFPRSPRPKNRRDDGDCLSPEASSCGALSARLHQRAWRNGLGFP